MKKAKKLGLQSLALVLMAFVLVAGVAFGMTGAWFQDSDTLNEQTITMGHEVIAQFGSGTYNRDFTFSLTNSRSGATTAMPGDTLTPTSTLVITNNLKSSAMYLFVKVKATVSGVDNEEDNPLAAIAAKFAPAAVTGISTDVTNSATAAKAAGWTVYEIGDLEQHQTLVTIVTADGVKIPTTITNSAADQSITITYSLFAVQKANVDLATTVPDSVAEVA